MADHEDDADDPGRFKQLPEPVRLSQTTITYAAVPASLVTFGDGCAPFGGADGDGD